MNNLVLMLFMVCSIASSNINSVYEQYLNTEKTIVVTDDLYEFEVAPEEEITNSNIGVCDFAIEAFEPVQEPAEIAEEPESIEEPESMVDITQERLVMDSMGVDVEAVFVDEITQKDVDTHDVVYSMWLGQYHVTGHSNLTMGNIKKLKVGDRFWFDGCQFEVTHSAQGKLNEARNNVISDETGNECLYKTDIYMVTCHREKYGADGRWVILGKKIITW